jgi:hypothetical protein
VFECPAEFLVVVFEVPDPGGGGFEALQQRGIAGSLPGRGRGGRAVVLSATETVDLGSQVHLGVEPGPGDAGLAGDCFEGDRPFPGGRDPL